MSKFLFLFLITCCLSIGWAQVDTLNSIEKAFRTFKSDYALKNASISFQVVRLKDKKVIAEYNPNQSMVSASTMKVVTTATALEILGSYKKFETQLLYSGHIDSNCVLHGDIIIKGGGDPTLGSKYFYKNQSALMHNWADDIAKLGIHKIEGRIIADASYFSDEYVPSTWSWGDMGNYYGTGVSGLNIYDNTLKFNFSSGPKNGDSTVIECIEPYCPGLTIDNRVKAGKTKKDLAYIYGGPFDQYRLIKGTIPMGVSDFIVKGSMHDPAYVAAFELESILWKMDIPVSKTATTNRNLEMFENEKISSELKLISKIESPSLSKIVYWTNLISNNLFAETLLRQIGKKKYKDGSVFSSTLAVQKFWKSKDVVLNGFYMNDGSGLSRSNAISARNLVQILEYMKTKSKYKDSFYSSLPIAGKTGTLKSYGRKTAIQGNLRAKSGTMTRVKSFAGYVKDKSGENLAFAIIVNNHTCTTYQIGKKLEKLMISLGNYSDS